MAERTTERAVREQTIFKHLPVDFTQSELIELSQELATAHITLGRKELAKKEVTANITAEISSLKSRIAELATKVHDKYELRDVECRRIFDYDKGEVMEVRTDTGEILKERAMTAEETQVPLPETEDPGEAPEGMNEDPEAREAELGAEENANDEDPGQMGATVDPDGEDPEEVD